MCGINGIADSSSKEPRSRIIRAMNKAIFHRGPEGEGIFLSKSRHVAFGFRRLAIVDVRNGAQPIRRNENGHEYSVVCNGEIYNHDELRYELMQKGHSFSTGSDAETLLVSYIEWGEKCIRRFNGDFAFAVYDGAADSLFIARDRLGVKPLFYSPLAGGGLVFSSEPKGILAYPGFPREPDGKAIAEFFLGTFSMPDGSAPLDRSFFKGIRSFLPGTYAIFRHGKLKTTSYWKVQIKKEKGHDHIDRLREEVEKSVSIRIPKEVGFGSALSGGLDSSIIASIIRGKGIDAPSTCIRFTGSGNNPDYRYSQMLAKEKMIRLVPTDITAEKIISNIDHLVYAMDEPHDALRQLGLFAVYKTLNEEGCKVALVGEGADEFNLGYFHLYPGFRIDLERCNDSEGFRACLRSKVPQVSQYFTEEFLQSVDFERLIDFKVSTHYDECDSSDHVDKMQHFYIKKFLKYRLDANDRCSMAHSVEARVPFCDHNVAAASLAVPNDLNLMHGTEKHALREAFRHLLPQEIAQRRKYPLPENGESRLHMLLAHEMDRNIETADPGIWRILDKMSIIRLNKRFKMKIRELEKSGNNSQLTRETPMHEQADVKVKHVFAFLTLIRWYQMYFAKNSKK